MRNFGYMAAAASIAALLAGPAMAGGLPASQAAIAYDDLSVVDTVGKWTPIMAQAIKSPGNKGLNINVSLECGLLTKTHVKSKGGKGETATANASVKVRVGVDIVLNDDGSLASGAWADPVEYGEGITYCQRTQELTAVFQGIFTTDQEVAGWLGDEDGLFYEDNAACVAGADGEQTCAATTLVGTCLYQGADGGVWADLSCFEPEEVALLLDTMSANSYNFYVGSEAVDSGEHTVTVEAYIDASTGIDCGQLPEEECQSSSADQQAVAYLGHGSMYMGVIRLIKNHADNLVDLTGN